MAVDRLLPTAEARDLLALVRDIADKELAPRVEEHERTETYPEGLFATLGAAGLLGLPYPEEWGGGGQPYEVYLQVLEELASRWAAVAVAVSVQALACHPIAAFGSPEQQERWLPPLLAGELLAGYSLSEPQAGSDAAALACKAERTDDGYRITGTKAWITHGGKVDLYALFARTGPGSGGVSCFLAPGHADGLSFGKPEQKMGLHAIPTVDRALGRRGDRRRPARRPRGPGPADRVQRARLRQAGHRRRGHRDRAGRARRGRRLRARAHGVRPGDHRPRGAGLPARRHGRGRRRRPRHLPRRRPPPRRGPAPTAARPRWRSSSRRTPR